MKSKLFITSILINILLLVLTIGMIFYFIVYKNGIVIDKTITTISTSYSSSGSLAIGYIGGDYKGNWIIQEQKCNSIENVYEVLCKLDPIQFINAKIIPTKNTSYSYYVYYPCISSVIVKKTIINGTEIK